MGRGRAPCCQKIGLNKGSWTREEDVRLIAYIMEYGHQNWRTLPKLAGLLRCGKSCRLRWVNYLRPGIKRGNFTKEEEDTIIELHDLLGNKWSKIAACLPGRTDNEIKNVWNTHLRKRRDSGNTNLPPPNVLVDKHEDYLLSSPSSAITSTSFSSLDKIEIPMEAQFDVGSMLDDTLMPPPMEKAMTAFKEDSIPAVSIDGHQSGGFGGAEKGWWWLSDLEVELGLLDGGGSGGGNKGGGNWKERLVGGEEDPVECYFHSRWPSSPSLQKS